MVLFSVVLLGVSTVVVEVDDVVGVGVGVYSTLQW